MIFQAIFVGDETDHGHFVRSDRRGFRKHRLLQQHKNQDETKVPFLTKKKSSKFPDVLTFGRLMRQLTQCHAMQGKFDLKDVKDGSERELSTLANVGTRGHKIKVKRYFWVVSWIMIKTRFLKRFYLKQFPAFFRWDLTSNIYHLNRTLTTMDSRKTFFSEFFKRKFSNIFLNQTSERTAAWSWTVAWRWCARTWSPRTAWCTSSTTCCARQTAPSWSSTWRAPAPRRASTPRGWPAGRRRRREERVAERMAVVGRSSRWAGEAVVMGLAQMEVRFVDTSSCHAFFCVPLKDFFLKKNPQSNSIFVVLCCCKEIRRKRFVVSNTWKIKRFL